MNKTVFEYAHKFPEVATQKWRVIVVIGWQTMEVKV